MSRDYRNYKNPEVFDPTRFLSDLPELDPKVYIFGFGRRICAGIFDYYTKDSGS
jgi:cytochrome P450